MADDHLQHDLEADRSENLNESSNSSYEFSEDSDEVDDDDDDDEEEEEEANPVMYDEQSVALIQYSSYKSKTIDSVPRNTDVEYLCQSSDTGCIENNSSEQRQRIWYFSAYGEQQTLVVSFGMPLFIYQIDIHEVSNSESIRMLEVFHDERKSFFVMWKRRPSQKLIENNPNIFQPKLRRYRFPSNTVRITFQSDNDNPIGIKSIKMIGSTAFDSKVDEHSILESMNELYRRAVNRVGTDVQFVFEDKFICAHRNILYCRSNYFRTLLSEDFKEGKQKEPIQLTDVDYETFLQILHFIYTATYRAPISCDIAIKAMFYSNKINLLTAKDAAIEHICCHLRANYQDIFQVYCLIKNLSPSFDLLLEYIYDLCTENLAEICNQKEFKTLEKDYLIDLICQVAKRRERKLQEQAAEVVEPVVNENDSDSDSDNEDDF